MYQKLYQNIGQRISINIGGTSTTSPNPNSTDIENGGYTSSQVDTWLNHHAFVLNTTGQLFILKGNQLRTSASDAAYEILELTNGFYED